MSFEGYTEMNLLAQSVGKPCPYCGVTMTGGKYRPTRDHVRPKSGGHSLSDNRLIVCFKCNQRKGDKPLREFLSAIEEGVKG